MARMRDRLIYGYFSVDYDIVWDIIKNEASKLLSNVETILDREQSK